MDDPTVDVSPFGVRSLISGPPEWCRDWFSERPFEKGRPDGPAKGTTRVVRGWAGATRNRQGIDPKRQKDAPGIRLVRALNTG